MTGLVTGEAGAEGARVEDKGITASLPGRLHHGLDTAVGEYDRSLAAVFGCLRFGLCKLSEELGGQRALDRKIQAIHTGTDELHIDAQIKFGSSSVMVEGGVTRTPLCQYVRLSRRQRLVRRDGAISRSSRPKSRRERPQRLSVGRGLDRQW